jgi:hypothetical protein
MNATIQLFKSEATAMERCSQKNKACKLAGNMRDVYAVVEHPVGFAVVDLKTAIELESGYRVCY